MSHPELRQIHLSGYGSVWKRFDGRAGTLKIGRCPKCGKKCGHDLYSFVDTPKTSSESVEYTISRDGRVVAQRMDDELAVRLMSAAPDMYRLLVQMADAGHVDEDDDGYRRCRYCRAVPDSYPGQDEYVPHERSCLWRKVAEQLERMSEPLRVHGRHDDTIDYSDLSPFSTTTG